MSPDNPSPTPLPSVTPLAVLKSPTEEPPRSHSKEPTTHSPSERDWGDRRWQGGAGGSRVSQGDRGWDKLLPSVFHIPGEG